MSQFRRVVVAMAFAAGALASAASWAQSGPYQYFAVTPCRVIDTRVNGGQTNGAALANPGPHGYRIRNSCGIPATATAVSLNLTIVQPSRFGDARLYPFNQVTNIFDPSTINYNGGETIANGAILPLSPTTDPADDMKILIGMTGPGTTHLIIDVTGYFQ